ncbi:MAG: branched-chain amino acid ABC transporter permease [Nitrospinaceae bacterium]|jgi:branched-chain amino acid transport system permease protein|nr:branched-chain amino acid ABC transporter permease [Nitrospinaceae bacterium]MBT3434655.1 branched-chain amino acid ABC transporter permease [Nitrospinaceae bacterium]MBT4094043.1 branched-chain amino acid ABC transporter permease [Nitrospinaceae bacterium]MBT4432593.1 branched-chain amino acid ABC transporter permease [Nitrospinaceae bacterium]MBT5366843.1 branched-chain amino acid ABC transporter permease [Nitrospinaceae bacterium]
MFTQQLVNGVVVGAVYALVALGYTLVYGILKLINFAHGEIYMIGAYIGIATLSVLGSMGITQFSVALTIVLVFFIPMIYCAAYGVTMERVAYRPLRNAPRLSPLISAIGMSIFLQNYVQVAQGARDKAFPNLLALGGFELWGAYISGLQIFILLTALGIMAALQLFIQKTKLGRAMRATAQDRTMASLVGVDVNRVIAATFAIGSALAAIAGVMVGMYYGLVNHYSGFITGMKAFTAAVLGGIGSVPGALLGGFLLAMLESFWAGYVSAIYKDVFAFAVLVVVLIFRPEGLLGASENTDRG